NGLSITSIKQITKQILVEIQTMHSKAKLVHMDIKPENILLKGISKEIYDFVLKFKEIDIDDLFLRCKKIIIKELNKQNENKKRKKKLTEEEINEQICSKAID